jgi:hypothetical protein
VKEPFFKTPGDKPMKKSAKRIAKQLKNNGHAAFTLGEHVIHFVVNGKVVQETVLDELNGHYEVIHKATYNSIEDAIAVRFK